ncbi:MAG: DsrE family protein [Candidatus Helarchaeota archaeon]
MQKSVVILITSPPFGDLYSYEGIRLSTGLLAGEIDLKIFFIGKGILNMLKYCIIDQFTEYLDIINEMEIKKYICIEDVSEMNLLKDDFIENLIFENRINLAKMCHEADYTLKF